MRRRTGRDRNRYGNRNGRPDTISPNWPGLPETRCNSHLACETSGREEERGTPPMPLNRILPVMLAIALGGCGAIGAIGLPPVNRNEPPPDTLAGGLPPPLPGEDPNAVAPAATGDAII